MGGGLLQLVAYGAQDVYLTGNPQITFFKVVYRRHTNFALEAIEQSYNGNTSFGSRVTVQITRNGDLINRIYFLAQLFNSNATASTGAAGYGGFALVPYFGHKLLKTIELEIGGQRIDKHYSEWLYIWNELSLPYSKKQGYDAMVGGSQFNNSQYLAPQQGYELHVPLEFWFCRNVGLALPLIALQYHEVKINIEFETAANMIDKGTNNYCDNIPQVVFPTTSTSVVTGTGLTVSGYNNTTGAFTQSGTYVASGFSNDKCTTSISNLELKNVAMYVDYIFLDTDERRRFAQLSHEYLIEQLQFTGTDNISASSTNSMKAIRLNFNHPCKELIWVIKPTPDSCASLYWNNFSDRTADNINFVGKNPTTLAKIQLNGNDRMTERPGNYFSRVQCYQHHENIPTIFKSGINVYSFGIKPEEHQPSGTLNMSRIDTANLNIASSVNGSIYVFAVNYNVLRILSGMGGLAYSN